MRVNTGKTPIPLCDPADSAPIRELAAFLLPPFKRISKKSETPEGRTPLYGVENRESARKNLKPNRTKQNN